MIKQRSWGDCGIAAFMNALFDDGQHYHIRPGGYEEIVDLFGRDHGITIQELCAALFEYNFLPVHLPLEGFADASGIQGAKCLSAEYLCHSYLGQYHKAIYQVKTKSGVLHYIYHDGCMIWDSLPNSPAYPNWDDYEAVVDVVYLLPNISLRKNVGFDEIAEYLKDYVSGINEYLGGSECELASLFDGLVELTKSKMKPPLELVESRILGISG